MKKRLISIVTVTMVISAMLFITALSAQLTALDLGKVQLSSFQDTVEMYKSMLAQGVESVYTAEIVNKTNDSIKLNEAEALAAESFRDTPLYFRNGTYLDRSTNQYVFYVGKADYVMLSISSFNQFLDGQKGSEQSVMTLKLNDYAENSNYPYPKNCGFNGTYYVSDIRISDNAVLRTISRNTSADAEVSKSYKVSTYEEMKLALKDGLMNFYEKISFQTTVSSPETFDVLKAYIDLSVNTVITGYTQYVFYWYYGNDYIVTFVYFEDSIRCKELYQKGLQKADEILQTIIQPNMDDFDKVRAVHDYVTAHTKYDNYTLHFNLPHTRVSSFIGPIIDELAICGGYSSAMKILLEKAGIECFLLNGDADNGDGNQGHVWNIVKLNGLYYHLDSTWDDPTSNEISYDYFLVDDNQISKNHSWNRENYPPCIDDRSVTEDFNGIAYGKEKFSIVGSNGFMASSNDGIVWTSTVPVSSMDLNSVCFGKNVFIAVGNAGTILLSENTLVWSVIDTSIENNLKKVCFINNRFFAVGENGLIATSNDGLNWAILKSGTNKTLHAIIYGKGKYVCVGSSGIILTSSNGEKWIIQESKSNNDFLGIAYGNELFISIGNSNELIKSSDGIKWNKLNYEMNLFIKEIIYEKGKFIAVGKEGLSIFNKETLYASSYDYDSVMNFIIFDGNQFVAVGEKGKIFMTKDNDINKMKKYGFTFKKSM